MLQKEPLIALSFVVVFGAIVAGYNLPADRLSAIGSIVAGVGSVLAVIWFSASLYYQGQQIKEQREQFSKHIYHMSEDARRDAIALAKDILDDAQKKAVEQNKNISNIGEIGGKYVSSLPYYKILFESKNAKDVLDAFNDWNQYESSAITFLNGIKQAAEVYFKAVGRSDIDYSKEVDQFVYIYSPHFNNLPYFSACCGPALVLAQLMFTLEPGRKSAALAGMIAATLCFALDEDKPEKLLNVDRILDAIKKIEDKNYLVPPIANDFIKRFAKPEEEPPS